MREIHASTRDYDEPERYEIRLKGHLDDCWVDWFEGLNISHESDGTTILAGPLADQAALHGVLSGIRDLGLPIISVQSVGDARTRRKKMKAIVYTEYGSPEVLQLKEVEKPSPRADEVLVKVEAAAANPLDWRIMSARPFLVRLDNGFQKPKITQLGADVAGWVEAVGRNVTQFQPGDAVFGETFKTGLGGFAEYVSVPEKTLALKPANLSFEAAAAVPIAALTALQGLCNEGQLQAGQQVLINGASGGLGTYAVQIAKALGTEVTGVCSNRNVDLVRSIGADYVIDYTREDFTRMGRHYDLIYDAVGNRSPIDLARALKLDGICVVAGFTTMSRLVQVMLLGGVISRIGGKTIGLMETVHTDKDDLLFLQELLEAEIIVPVIDRCYPLRETAEAIRYLETGRARGKVIITVA